MPNGVLLVDFTDDAESMQRTLCFEQGKFSISGLEVSEIYSFEPLPTSTDTMFTKRNIEEYLLNIAHGLNQADATDMVGKWDLSEPYNPHFIKIYTPEHNEGACIKSILVEFSDNPPNICIEFCDNIVLGSVEYSYEVPVKPGENKYVEAFREVCSVARALASGHISKFLHKSELFGIKIKNNATFCQ